MNITAGYNWRFVLIELLGFVVWVSLIRNERGWSDAWWHTIGLAMHSLGTIFRISFWAFASQLPGEEPCGKYPNWACDGREMLFWAIQLSTVGMACMLRARFIDKLGRWWAVPTLAIACLGFSYGAFF